MRLAVLVVVSPTASLQGYVRRFLTEWVPGTFVGSVTGELARDLTGVLTDSGTSGFLIMSSSRSEVGFEVLFSNLNERSLSDFDGVPLIEKSRAVSCHQE